MYEGYTVALLHKLSKLTRMTQTARWSGARARTRLMRLRATLSHSPHPSHHHPLRKSASITPSFGSIRLKRKIKENRTVVPLRYVSMASTRDLDQYGRLRGGLVMWGELMRW